MSSLTNTSNSDSKKSIKRVTDSPQPEIKTDSSPPIKKVLCEKQEFSVEDYRNKFLKNWSEVQKKDAIFREFKSALENAYRQTIHSGTLDRLDHFLVNIENGIVLDFCNPSNYKDIPTTDSPFGRGRERIVDPEVRLSKEYRFGDMVDSKIVSIAQNVVSKILSNDYYCKPYKFIIYEEGAFFEEHTDTPETDLEYTLCLVLPTTFTGGEFKFGKEITVTGDESQIKYILFKINCPHNIEKVTSGVRLVVTYKVYRCVYDICKYNMKLDVEFPELLPQIEERNILVEYPNPEDLAKLLLKSDIGFKWVGKAPEDSRWYITNNVAYSIPDSSDVDYSNSECEDFLDLVKKQNKSRYHISRTISIGSAYTKENSLQYIHKRGINGNSPVSDHYEVPYCKLLLINPESDGEYDSEYQEDYEKSDGESSDETYFQLDE